MARSVKDADKLDEAISHIRAGKSPREAEKLTGVNYRKIHREAQARGVEKGELSRYIEDKTRIDVEFVSLCDTDKRVVTDIVDERVRHVTFFNNAAIKNVAQAMLVPCDTQQDFKMRSETIAKGREVVLGKTPDTALQINQNIDTGPKKVQFEVLDGNQVTTH